MKSVFAALLALCTALCAGCITLTYSPTPTPLPDYMIITESDYFAESMTTYFPAGSTQNTAQYVLNATYPVFNDDAYRAQELNAAVREYLVELENTVIYERLPLADPSAGGQIPSTNVSITPTCARGIVNLHISDSYVFAAQESVETSCIVMQNGEKVGLASISGSPDARLRAAQQVINIIGANNPDYFSSLTLFDVYEAIDPVNGFFATEEGYVLLFAQNTIAPAVSGNIEMPISRESLYPDAVGSTITIAQYETILPAVNILASASAKGFESFGNGVAETYTATCFMAQLVIKTGDVLAENGRISLPADEFEGMYSLYFDSDFPGLDAAAHDITLENEVYSLFYQYAGDDYYFVLSDARVDGNIIELIGEIVSGDMDAEETERVCGASVTIRLDSSTETGFKFVGITIS